MTRRMRLLMGVAALLTLTAGGMLAAWANARTTAETVDCCLDPTCPPGCSEICPPDCTDLPAAKTEAAAKPSRCCDDLSCPPGCTLECAAECLPAVKSAELKAKKDCPPCPFCP